MGDAVVRVGDRYVAGDLRITITHVDRDPMQIRYAVLNRVTEAEWQSRTGAIPAAWEKVYSAPRPVTKCVECQQADAEPGQLYCWDCAVDHAGEWAGLSDVDATAKMVSLIEKAENT